MTVPAFAAVGFAHPHVVSMAKGLLQQGIPGTLVWDENPQQCQALHDKIPGSRPARALEEILANPQVRLICSAVEPRHRASIGLQALRAGKDVLMAKPGLISRDELADLRTAIATTGRRFLVFFSERLTSPETALAESLVRDGAIGQVVHHLGLGPHLLGGSRPAWFYPRASSGGIINDLGTHQIDQFLVFTGGAPASVTHASVHESRSPDGSGWFQDLGEACLTTTRGASSYFRIDWHSPAGFPAYGDSRTFLTGTHGTIEIRRTIDPFTQPAGSVLLLTDANGQRREFGRDLPSHPFFQHLAQDLHLGSTMALDQQHVLQVLELCLAAQERADQHSSVSMS